MTAFLVSLFKQLGIKDYAIGGMSIVVIYCVTMWHQSSVELKKAQVVYAHPQIKTVEHIVYREGPVHIVTKIVEVPGGQKETVITEDRAPVTNEIVSSSTSTPIPLAVALIEPRTDRYLVTLGMNRLTADFDGKALFVGYGFKNRLDVQVGGVEHNGFSPWVLATIRF